MKKFKKIKKKPQPICILSEALPMGADGELPFWAAVIVTGAVDAKSSYESSLSMPETPSPSKMSLEPPPPPQPRRSPFVHKLDHGT